MVTLPPRRAKLHYTFDNSSLEEIGKTNFALLSKLNSIATRAPVFGEGKAAKTSPKVFKPRGATERERRAAQIDRDNLFVTPHALTPQCARLAAPMLTLPASTPPPQLVPNASILLRKIQSTKPEVTKFTRGGISVRNEPWGLEGGAAPEASPKRSRPEWVDSTSSAVPRPARREAAGGGGGATGRTKTFKNPSQIALDACPEKHLL